MRKNLKQRVKRIERAKKVECFVFCLFLSVSLRACFVFFMIFTFSNLISESDSEQSSMLTVVATPSEALGKTVDVGVGVDDLIRSTLSSLSLECMKNNNI